MTAVAVVVVVAVVCVWQVMVLVGRCWRRRVEHDLERLAEWRRRG